MRLQDRNMIGGAGVSLQKNGASGILFQFVKDEHIQRCSY